MKTRFWRFIFTSCKRFRGPREPNYANNPEGAITLKKSGYVKLSTAHAYSFGVICIDRYI